MADNRVKFIAQLVKAGLSGNAIQDRLRQEGWGMRRESAQDLIRQIRNTLKTQATGIDRDGSRKPFRKEILFMATALESGFLQYVDIWVKVDATGEIYPRPFTIKTDQLWTHDDVIATALDRYADMAPDYGEKILGASYMATYEMVPGL